MNRRERLEATFAGRPVDRPAVSFYEIGMFRYDPDDPDPYNVHTSESWRSLIDLAERETDLIRGIGIGAFAAPDDRLSDLVRTEQSEQGGSRFTRTTITVGGRALTRLDRRDRDTDTGWTIEHLLKNADDARAWLELPVGEQMIALDDRRIADADAEIGDRGVVGFDTGDPLCAAAAMFSMEDYTIVAMTEPALFRRLLDRVAEPLYRLVDAVAERYPGRHWRVCGAEYASEPYLPPNLFAEYVGGYTTPIVRAIQKHGGFARLHSHGRLKNILPHIAEIAPDGLDPIEPPPQGDVELIDVRRQYGRDWVLFGNLEASDLENLPTDAFREKIQRALREGTAGEGRGFVLMPSACPYGREIPDRVLNNYRAMIELANAFDG